MSYQATLVEVLESIQAEVPPLWPLEDYVAVNPFLGFSDTRFLDARCSLRSYRPCEMLMPFDYFQARFQEGQIADSDLQQAYEACRVEYPEFYDEAMLRDLLAILYSGKLDVLTEFGEREYFSIAEALDGETKSNWNSIIVEEVSRHLASHFDSDQAAWQSPWKSENLWFAWKSSQAMDVRMERLGVQGFRRLVQQLPASPEQAILQLLQMASIPAEHWKNWLSCQLATVAGWAAYVQYRIREASAQSQSNSDLWGLIAIRLAYDVSLLPCSGGECPSRCVPKYSVRADAGQADSPRLSASVRYRYLLQSASELAYRRKLTLQLLDASNQDVQESEDSRRSLAQFVFCIDVRSEVMRRHLESTSPRIETFGFAGFFGMAMEYVPLGEARGSAQCPVLLKPAFTVREELRGVGHHVQAGALKDRRFIRQYRKIWKSFQSSAVSCFTFVESLGLLYFGKLITDSLGWTRPVGEATFDGVPLGNRKQLGPVIEECHGAGLAVARQIDVAEGMLRNLGLVTNLAKLVVLCGHECKTTNNPYRAGLDCGACGGHSGATNARVAAQLLNSPSVRSGLAERGIQIPTDTHFLGAVHNTTTDQISLLDEELVPAEFQSDLNQVKMSIEEASKLCRSERAPRLGAARGKQLERKSRDWSEVRPEWGLAGNAAFIVAPRARTKSLKLDGRTFMHSYDHRQDPDSKVLELIMTAPMVVTNWINLQYYASTVDNRSFGSGNKVIHNVVGQIGILEGNGGDLKTGLPWQSLHDGQSFQHEPLRLWVVVEAPRRMIAGVLAKHPMVDDLVRKGWLSLASLEDDVMYQYQADASWKRMEHRAEEAA